MVELLKVYRAYITAGNGETETMLYIYAHESNRAREIFKKYCEEDTMFGDYYLSSCSIRQIPGVYVQTQDMSEGIHLGEDIRNNLNWVWQSS